MDQFVLIIRHEDSNNIATAEDIETWKQLTKNWVDSIAAANQLVTATGLPFDEAAVVWPEHMVTNGAFGERKQTIGGIVTVTVNSFDEALELAKRCPVVDGEGNSVEVRRAGTANGFCQ